jgi:hypothetical protein
VQFAFPFSPLLFSAFSPKQNRLEMAEDQQQQLLFRLLLATLVLSGLQWAGNWFQVGGLLGNGGKVAVEDWHHFLPSRSRGTSPEIGTFKLEIGGFQQLNVDEEEGEKLDGKMVNFCGLPEGEAEEQEKKPVKGPHLSAPMLP